MAPESIVSDNITEFSSTVYSFIDILSFFFQHCLNKDKKYI